MANNGSNTTIAKSLSDKAFQDTLLQNYVMIASQVMELEKEVSALSQGEMQDLTRYWKQEIAAGRLSLDECLARAFAVAREASFRVTRMKPYFVQIVGGLVLHDGKIAEMGTGEGKTLAAVMPAFVNALMGKGVHVVTVNEYLAQRDFRQMGSIYRYLGLSVGCVVHSMDKKTKARNYNADVTFVTSLCLGWDHLWDGIAENRTELVMNPEDSDWKSVFNYAIVDEADSVLIDEGRNPLLLSAPPEETTQDRYHTAYSVVLQLLPSRHYEVDRKSMTCNLTDEGNSRSEELLRTESLYEEIQVEDNYKSKTMEPWAKYVLAALKAKELFVENKDYILRRTDGEVKIEIVDPNTGRILPGRRWTGGIHEAIEAKHAKDGVKVEADRPILAEISYQSLFKNYTKLSGMTGTAATEQKEFYLFYNLEVVCVPPNKPRIRTDFPPEIYLTKQYKKLALLKEIFREHMKGRPVLVGTSSVSESEELARSLTKYAQKNSHVLVPFVLNARPELAALEADIVAQAGRFCRVTIATNMAGRGTDILLGGNPDFCTKYHIREEVLRVLCTQTDSLGLLSDGRSDLLAETPLRPDDNPVYVMSENAQMALRSLRETVETFKRLCISFCEIFGRPEYEFAKSDWEEAINNVLAGAGTKIEETHSEKPVNGVQNISDSTKALTAGSEKLPVKTDSMAPVDSLIISLRLEQIDNAEINREEADRVESVLVKIGDLMVRQIRLAWRELEPCYKDMCAYEGNIVRSVGGLHVIGFQYYETERIDNQLRGRAGRQGDPGSSKFFGALDDELFVKHTAGSILVTQNMLTNTLGEDNLSYPIDGAMIGNMINRLRRQVEDYNMGMRKQVHDYSAVVDTQRGGFYSLRRGILFERTKSVKKRVYDYCEDVVLQIVLSSSQNLNRRLGEWKIEDTVEEIMDLMGMRKPNGQQNAAAGTIFENIHPNSVLFALENEKTVRAILRDMHFRSEEFTTEEGKQFREERYQSRIERWASAEWRDRRGINAKLEQTWSLFRKPRWPFLRDLVGILSEAVICEYEMKSGLMLKSITDKKGFDESTASDLVMNLERMMITRALDKWWSSYLEKIRRLQTTSSLRAFGQLEPLDEYRIESAQVLRNMMKHARRTAARYLFQVELSSDDDIDLLVEEFGTNSDSNIRLIENRK